MPKVTARLELENYRTVVSTDDHLFIVDEPISSGGKDLGADPGELLAASLATCTAATMKMYANRKEWKLDEIIVKVDFKKELKANKTVFQKEIELKGDLTEEQKERLYEIAAKCPIHRVLTEPIEIESKLK